ncbi:polyprotein [Bathycoccus prasinos]|uniref:Polyprotein n=1 Tax=Bathycoccus prasinos TaxID=41875 RepID=K8EE69_9CHLO|nr:polyprotein [Bathycoccus prasinos]CCO16377.1 polyprotein [Bathycoccus prasinos]|eukprot:XP_007513852.1 polyprotein [Bathycoccus prasinos]
MHEVNLSDYSEIRKLKIVSLRMLVTVKQDNTSKARLVARGFLQREGINYFQTYSPVIKLQSSRLLLQLAAITCKKIWRFKKRIKK